MILDHPLRKAFTIEEAALVAAGLTQYDSFKDSLSGTRSFIDKNSERFKQTDQYKVIEQRKLAKEFLAMFKQGYLDGIVIPYVDFSIGDVDRMLFCRKSLSRVLESKGREWYCFYLDENKSFSYPKQYASLVHDNQFKLGFTPTEIALIFYDIGSINSIEESTKEEYSIQRTSELSLNMQEVENDECIKLMLYKEDLLLVKRIFEIEAKRIIQNIHSTLVLEKVFFLPDSESINYESLTFTRASIRQYLNEHDLKMQGELFVPYESKLETLGTKIFNDIQSKKTLVKRDKTRELAAPIWEWAHKKYLEKETVTQGECCKRYEAVMIKLGLGKSDCLAERGFREEMKHMAEEKGLKFTQSHGLQKIKACA